MSLMSHPMPLLAVVSDDHRAEHATRSADRAGALADESYDNADLQASQRRSRFKSPPGTPSARTGPPRSISYTYSLPNSPVLSLNNASMYSRDEFVRPVQESGLSFSFAHGRAPTEFRGVLETNSDFVDKKGKRKENRMLDDNWKSIKKFPSDADDTKGQRSPSRPKVAMAESEDMSMKSPQKAMQIGIPPFQSTDKTRSPKWGRLRSLLPSIIHHGGSAPVSPEHSAVVPQAVNIADELVTGGLSTLLLRLWFERDEKGHRRVPVLFHHLHIRVSDSLHPLQRRKTVFRIECEYANGATRWVIYRRLRDFISLHTHYTLSNAFNRNVDKLPEFPRTSIPYFKFLKKESRDKGDQLPGRVQFARLQREALENYLIDLIRAVMFLPAANRLARFFEMSALSINLAQSGGSQYKAGFLKIESCASKGAGFGRKSTGWRQKKESRWCAVRESYLVVLEEPGELTVWDVFLLDSDFKIERPKRYYRQGLNLLHPDTHADDVDNMTLNVPVNDDNRSTMGTIGRRLSNLLRVGHHSRHENIGNGVSGTAHHESPHMSSNSLPFSAASRPPTPMLDPSTNINPLLSAEKGTNEPSDPMPILGENDKKKSQSGDVSKHTFYIENAQMRLKLFAHNERQMLQWITALERVAATSHYTGGNRFDSFSPIRLHVAAQWLVDGRDYFWNLSRAILLARETIYIHDWWLSPELQLRRPNKEKYRLDNLLERKAKEGVKIYIILYQEVSNRTTPTDSNYTKQRLMALHPNIMIQRSPSHFQTGTFYWAHHEKMCVIDQVIAFMGGIDLCFGRWDTPQHVLLDDPDIESSMIWPGKDYSNPRVSDFHTLHKPEEDMYDRGIIPRMPWHDVGMQVVGQPSRDLARHFVERWNYLLRIKNHSRPMPFLLPPPEFRPGELSRMGLTGTCEMQICRSAGPWSLGTPNKVEHSIQNAYLKAIQMSEHFVYIENQFFITSTVVNDVKVGNNIGDAIVHRIIRAYRERTQWKCCIILPLFPGFAFPVDHSDASAIRIILECQNRTIARGPNSIFSRLRKEGIDPDAYISIFALRNWAKLRGDILTTEQVYIHGKLCIVDDRLAIIGSANINERSQRGDRDSELAAVIRDTDMIDCTMAGKPYKVGRFAHTLRVRLMREHVGVDVDAMSEEDIMDNDPIKPEHDQGVWDPDSEQKMGQEDIVRVKSKRTPVNVLFQDVVHSVGQTLHGHAGEGEKGREFANANLPTVEENTDDCHLKVRGSPIGDKLCHSNGHGDMGDHFVSVQNIDSEPSDNPRHGRIPNGGVLGSLTDSLQTDEEPSLSRIDNDPDKEGQATVEEIQPLLGRPAGQPGCKTWTLSTPTPQVDPCGFEDPVSDTFWKDVWLACAVHNTEIYRKVFHAIPDDLITTWKQYKDFVLHHERMNKPAKDGAASEPAAHGPSQECISGQLTGQTESSDMTAGGTPVKNEDGADNVPETETHKTRFEKDREDRARKPARGSEPFEKWEREEMENLLGELRGHLVVYSNRFLEGEDIANNFLFNADRILPMPLYN